MADDDNAGTFGGDGSVRWEIRSGDRVHSGAQAKGAFKVAKRVGGTGTHCSGIDCDHDRNFVLTVKLPKGKTPKQFLESVKIRKDPDDKDGTLLVVNVPIKPIAKQIQVRWKKAKPATSV